MSNTFICPECGNEAKRETESVHNSRKEYVNGGVKLQTQEYYQRMECKCGSVFAVRFDHEEIRG